jgi:hypothetical protein
MKTITTNDNDTFASGLQDFFTVGSLYKRTYLTKSAKNIIIELIQQTMDNTCDMEDDEHDTFMTAIMYLRNKLNGEPNNYKLTPKIARTLHFWIIDNDNYLYNNKDTERACQYVCNLWCRKYSLSSIIEAI